jgi:hypothetical protein
MNSIDLRPLIAQFSQYPDFDGYLIAKARYEIRYISNNQNQTESISCDLLKQRTNYAVLKARRQCQHTHEQLTIHLLKPAKTAQTDAHHSKPQTDTADLPKVRFTQSDIASFVAQVKDYNTIHSHANAIVPGLLILEWLLQTITSNAKDLHSGYCIEVKYLHPLRAGENLYLQRDTVSDDNQNPAFSGVNETAGCTCCRGIYTTL